MGTTVYDTKEEICEVDLPKTAEVYMLHADTLRATTMKLNGKELVLGENNELPDMSPEVVEAGELTLAPETIAFVVM